MSRWIVWGCKKTQCKSDAQEKKVLVSLQAAIKELLSVSVEEIEPCCLVVQDMIKGHCASASRLLKR